MITTVVSLAPAEPHELVSFAHRWAAAMCCALCVSSVCWYWVGLLQGSDCMEKKGETEVGETVGETGEYRAE